MGIMLDSHVLHFLPQNSISPLVDFVKGSIKERNCCSKEKKREKKLSGVVYTRHDIRSHFLVSYLTFGKRHLIKFLAFSIMVVVPALLVGSTKHFSREKK